MLSKGVNSGSLISKFSIEMLGRRLKTNHWIFANKIVIECFAVATVISVGASNICCNYFEQVGWMFGDSVMFMYVALAIMQEVASSYATCTANASRCTAQQRQQQ